MSHAHDSYRIAIQSKRESAHFWGGTIRRFPEVLSSSNINGAETRSSKRVPADCLQRYPSLDRPALSQGRSIAFFRRSTKAIAIVIGYKVGSDIHSAAVDAHSGATSKQKLGRRLCKRNQSSSQLLLYLGLPVVLKATLNVALQVQALALSLPKFWVQTAQVQSWQVLPLVCCATTQVSTAAANRNQPALTARGYQWDRRRSMSAAAVLRFGDGK